MSMMTTLMAITGAHVGGFTLGWWLRGYIIREQQRERGRHYGPK